MTVHVRTSREAAILVVAAVSCICSPASSALVPGSTVALVAFLGVLCTAPGAALLPLLRGRVELGAVLATSIALSLLIAQSMLWFSAWEPVTAAYTLPAVCLPVIALHLRRLRVGAEEPEVSRAPVRVARPAAAPVPEAAVQAPSAAAPPALENVEEPAAPAPAADAADGKAAADGDVPDAWEEIQESLDDWQWLIRRT